MFVCWHELVFERYGCCEIVPLRYKIELLLCWVEATYERSVCASDQTNGEPINYGLRLSFSLSLMPHFCTTELHIVITYGKLISQMYVVNNTQNQLCDISKRQ